MMLRICLTICSMAVALPMYMASQIHFSMVTFGLQTEQIMPIPTVEYLEWRLHVLPADWALRKEEAWQSDQEEGAGPAA